MTPKKEQPKSILTSLIPAVVAGLVGAGATWLFVRPDTSAPPSAVYSPERQHAPPSVENLPPAQAAVTLGNWFYDHQRWAQAIEQYEAAIRLGLDNADVRTDLGNCYRFTGQPQKALELYRIAQQQDPQHENSLFNQAGLYAEVLHEPARAIAAAEEFIRRFPQSSGALPAERLIARLKAQPPGTGQRPVDWLLQDKAVNPTTPHEQTRQNPAGAGGR